jgi:hypothetical protein
MSNSNDVVDSNKEINWSEVIKKEARGHNDADFGEVQEIVLHYVLTEKGILNKDRFFLPTALVEGFDGDKLRFDISEEDAVEKFKRDESPTAKEYEIFDKKRRASQKKNFEPREIAEQKDEKIDKEFEERIRIQAEDKAKMEAERKAQSIAQQIQDKAKMEAERKAQSLIQQAEDRANVESQEVIKMEAEEKANEIVEGVEQKARREAERKSQSILQQAEDEARLEADRRSRELIQQAENRANLEPEDRIMRNQESTKIILPYGQEDNRRIEINGYDENDEFFHPFMTGINLWQDYSMLLMNLTKEIFTNTTKMARDFEDTIKKSWLISKLV